MLHTSRRCGLAASRDTFGRRVAVLAVTTLSIAVVGCAGPTPAEVGHALEVTVKDAAAHFDRKEYAECYQMLVPVTHLDPNYPGVSRLMRDVDAVIAGIRAEGRDMEADFIEACTQRSEVGEPKSAIFEEPEPTAFEPSRLGSNRSTWAPAERSIAAKALLYLPDRLLDLLDVVSLDLHFGPGLFSEVHVTRGLQAGGGARAVGKLGWHYKRQVGGCLEAEGSVAVLPVQARGFFGSIAGSSGFQSTAEASAGLQGPSQPLYQEYRDFWGIGGSSTFIFFGVGGEIHPLQFVDFLAGWIGEDFLRDDFSQHRPLRLSWRERQNLQLLMRAVAEREDPK